jgi:hypothetical protein
MDINDAGLSGTSISQLIKAASASNPMAVDGQAAMAELAKVGIESISACRSELEETKDQTARTRIIVSLLDEQTIQALGAAWRYSEPKVLAGFAQLSNARGQKATVNQVLQAVKRTAAAQEKQLRERLRRTISGRKNQANLSTLLQHDEIPKGLVVPASWDLDNDGVWSIKVSEDGNEDRTLVAPSPLLVVGRSWDIHSGETQLRLAWKRGTRWTFKTIMRSEAMDARPLVGLSKWDAPVSSRNAGTIVQYLTDFEAANMSTLPVEQTTGHMGWQAQSGRYGFVLGVEQHGLEDDKVSLVPDDGLDQIAKGWDSSGSWDGWIEAIEPALTRPLLMLSLYASAASPLLNVLDAPNFIVDWSGETSRGKTTALRVAGSVWGKPDERAGGIVYSWDSTRVWIEQTAGFLHSLPLILDDTKRARYKSVVSQTLYDFAFGQGRGRGAPGGIRKQASWRSIMLTTGEAPATSFSEDAGTRARVLTLKGPPLGRQSAENARAAMMLRSMLMANHGHLGPKIVQYLVNNRHRWDDLRSRYWQVRDSYVLSAGDDGVAARLAVYVAVLDVASSILHSLGVPKPEVDPMKVLWSSVVEGSQDADRPTEAIRDLYGWAVANQTRFWGRHEADPKDGTPRVPHGGWAGAWSSGGEGQLSVLPVIVRDLLNRWNYDVTGVIESWSRRGWILCNGRSRTRPVRMDGGRSRCIVFDSPMLEALTSADEE